MSFLDKMSPRHMVLVCFILVASLASLQASPVKPVFKDHYHASGQIRLPYAEIIEPFEIFFQGPKNRSRMDTYSGMDKVYFRGDEKDYGNLYKISPATLKGIASLESCFLIPGEKGAPVMPQSMLPDLTGFTFLSGGLRNGQSVNLWQNKTTMTFFNQSRTSTYTFAVTTTTPPRPVQYRMMGFDSLLGSHFDEYIIDYDFYDEATAISDDIFSIPKNLTCAGFPGPGVEQKIKGNPMREMVNPEMGDRLHQLFDEYKQKYDKSYKTDLEHVQRKGHFTKNVRMIHSINRANLGYVLDINHMADQSHQELKRMRGRLRQTRPNNGLPYDGSDVSDDAVPDHIDWNVLGAVSPVKDQAVCGSCWSFGSAETIEGAVFMQSGKRVRLSQQMLMDCTWAAGNNGCDGGEEWRVYEWLMKNGGIPLEETYGPYLGQNGMCHYDKSKAVASIKKYYNVTSGNQKDLKKALATKGPIAVGIDAAVPSFSFYSYGTYYDASCGNTVDDLDHAVLAVGYGTDSSGQDYWLIKNSWSTHWGNNGYVAISMKDNNCGVATAATYVELEKN
ncbi:crustapain [Strongylocentrotus purpuratus]|uniref:Counting factor associated protein D n=1 Tax=Strongylocentrotus purpuratus TaxID=7668 RepID=A0A7M7HI35_STRPU|nr:crustapain [Strongylocentrotus purpuratus]